MPGGTGFRNLADYLALNQSQGAQMAGAINNDLAQRADPVLRDVKGLAGAPASDELKGRVEDLQRRAQLAGAMPGQQAMLGEMYGRQGHYGAGQRGLDAFLTGASGGLKGVGNRYSSLGAYLSGAPQQQPGPTHPPPAPTPGGTSQTPPARPGDAWRRDRIDSRRGSAIGPGNPYGGIGGSAGAPTESEQWQANQGPGGYTGGTPDAGSTYDTGDYGANDPRFKKLRAAMGAP